MGRFARNAIVLFLFLTVSLFISLPWYQFLLSHRNEIVAIEQAFRERLAGLGALFGIVEHEQAARAIGSSLVSRVASPRSDGQTYRAAVQTLRVIEQHYVDSSRLSPDLMWNIGLEKIQEQMKKEMHLTLVVDSQAQAVSYSVQETGDVLVVPSEKSDSRAAPEERMGRVAAALLQWLEDTGIDSDSHLFRGYFNELLHHLDPHSSFLSEAEYDELRSGTRGQFGGVGVVISEFHGLPFVREIVANSPAQMAGIEPNDILIRVGESNVTYSSLESVLQSIRKTTRLGPLPAWFFRPHSGRVYQTFFSRDEVPTRSVEERTIPGNPQILLVRVSGFSSHTSQEIYDIYMNAMKRRSGALQSMILDLRGNPGGLLHQAVQVSDLFLSEGKIVVTKSRYDNQAELATPDDVISLPLVVLMNSSSASASEIVAGAIRDSGRGVIIGERSFGKGSVQSLFEIPKFGAIKLTIAHYFTPSNQSIQGTGVMPHIEVRLAQRKREDLWVAGGSEKRREEDLLRHLENPQLAAVTHLRPTAGLGEQKLRTFESPNTPFIWANTRDDLSSFGMLGQLSFSYPNYENSDYTVSLDQDAYVRVAVNLIRKSENSSDGIWSLVREYKNFLPQVIDEEKRRFVDAFRLSADEEKYRQFYLQPSALQNSASSSKVCFVEANSAVYDRSGKFRIEIVIPQEQQGASDKKQFHSSAKPYSPDHSAPFKTGKIEIPCDMQANLLKTWKEKKKLVGLVGFAVAGHAEQPSAWQTVEFFQAPRGAPPKTRFQGSVQVSRLFFTGFSSLRDAEDTAVDLYLKLLPDLHAFQIDRWNPVLDAGHGMNKGNVWKPDIKIIENFDQGTTVPLAAKRKFTVHVDFRNAVSTLGVCEVVLAPLVNRNVNVERLSSDCGGVSFRVTIGIDSDIGSPFDGVVGYLLLDDRGVINARDNLVEIIDGEARPAAQLSQLP